MAMSEVDGLILESCPSGLSKVYCRKSGEWRCVVQLWGSGSVMVDDLEESWNGGDHVEESKEWAKDGTT